MGRHSGEGSRERWARQEGEPWREVKERIHVREGSHLGCRARIYLGELYRERRIADSVSGVLVGDRTVCS